MSNKQFNKADEKLLREYAKNLPVVLHETHEVHYMTGAEIIEFGHVVKEGEKLDPEKIYAYTMPVQIAANHYRRLKKAWLKHGYEGVNKYIHHIGDLLGNKQNTENASI